jgi:hypothetical protein
MLIDTDLPKHLSLRYGREKRLESIAPVRILTRKETIATLPRLDALPEGLRI